MIVFFILYLGTRCFSVINCKIYCGLPVVWCLCDDCLSVFCCTFMQEMLQENEYTSFNFDLPLLH